MQRYQQILLTTRKGQLLAVPLATVTVYAAGTNTKAAIYSADSTAATTPNPTSTNDLGEVAFYAADGRYDILVERSGYDTLRVSDVLLQDPAEDGDVDVVQLRADVDLILAQGSYTPPSITSLTIDGQAGPKVVEQGAILSSLVLAWTLAGSTPTGQSLNNGIGAIPVGTLTKTVTGPVTASQTYTLTVSDVDPQGTTRTAQASVELQFRQKRHWGVSTATSLDSAALLALAGSEFATNKAKAVTYNATGGRYLYFAYPASFGALGPVTVNGLPFSDIVTTTVSATNASGHTSDYLVHRIGGLQNGASIAVTWS